MVGIPLDNWSDNADKISYKNQFFITPSDAYNTVFNIFESSNFGSQEYANLLSKKGNGYLRKNHGLVIDADSFLTFKNLANSHRCRRREPTSFVIRDSNRRKKCDEPAGDENKYWRQMKITQGDWETLDALNRWYCNGLIQDLKKQMEKYNDEPIAFLSNVEREWRTTWEGVWPSDICFANGTYNWERYLLDL